MAKEARVKLTMLKSDYDAINEIARSEGKSFSQYLASVVAIQAYIDQRRRDGATFLIESDGYQREILFR